MDADTNGLKESSYAVVAFPAAKFPDKYRNFMLSTWKNTFKGGHDYMRMIDRDAYFPVYHRYIESLLARPDSVIRFAVIPDSQDIALAWSLIERDILHYVFVTHEYRNQGIAKALVPGEINTFSHMTNHGRKIWVKKCPNVKFNPF